MKARQSLFLLAMCVVFVCGVNFSTHAQAQIDHWGYWKNEVSEPWWFSSAEFTVAQAEQTVARWKAIEEELRTSSTNAWSGNYFSGGETHGTYLRWSPQNGFVLADIDKCQARVMGVAFGKVHVSENVITLQPEFSNLHVRHKRQHSHNSLEAFRFIPVTVNDERMLVEERRMANFGNYVAGRGEYNNLIGEHSLPVTEFLTQFTLQQPTEPERRLSGPPTVSVPSGYAGFVKKPIEAVITRVGKRQVRKHYSDENRSGAGASYANGVSVTSVHLNAGADVGLKPGMIIRIVQPNEGDRVRIMWSDRTTAIGFVIRSLDDGKESFFSDGQERIHSKVVSGWKLTTSPF